MLAVFENALLAIVALCGVVAAFCFAMAWWVGDEERGLRRRLCVWERIAGARGMTFGTRYARPWFELQGSDPRVGALTVATSVLEGGLELAVVVKIPLADGAPFEFHLSRGHRFLAGGSPAQRHESLGDPMIDRAFWCATTDLPALRAAFDAGVRARIVAHPRWIVAAQARWAMVAWVEFSARTEERLFDDAVDLLHALFRREREPG